MFIIGLVFLLWMLWCLVIFARQMISLSEWKALQKKEKEKWLGKKPEWGDKFLKKDYPKPEWKDAWSAMGWGGLFILAITWGLFNFVTD